jgi:hypothetical protein
MTFRRAVLWLSAAVVAATESHAQVIPRFPIPARRRRLDRINACFFADHSWTRLGAPTSDPPIGRYRMKVIRFGYAVRVHVLHGRKAPHPAAEYAALK